MARGSGGEQGRRILTRPPEGKQGVNISREKYEAVSAAILRSMHARVEAPPQVVRQEVDNELRGRFEGSISWYFTAVKPDLEARGILERMPAKRPQFIRLRDVPG
jgi:hypothetical protein